MKKRGEAWPDLVCPELVSLLEPRDGDSERIKHQVADLVEQLPNRVLPLQAVDRVRSGALSAAGAAVAAEVAAARQEADEGEEALELRLMALQDALGPSQPAGYRAVGFVRESVGLALSCVATFVAGVMTLAIGNDTAPIGTATAIAGSTTLFAAVVCVLLEGRRAASLVSSVREDASPFYAAMAAFWLIGLVTTVVRVLWYDEVLGGRGALGTAAWAVALVLMIVLVLRSARTDRLDVVRKQRVDPYTEEYANGLGAIADRVREREARVFAKLPESQQDAVLAGELEGIRLLLAEKVIRPESARAAVLDVRDRRRHAR